MPPSRCGRGGGGGRRNLARSPGAPCAATLRGRAARASQFSLLAGIVVVGSLSAAVTLGGAAISERVASLFAASPVSVYQGARGTQLTITFFDLLFQYPIGAGLARW